MKHSKCEMFTIYYGFSSADSGSYDLMVESTKLTEQ